MPRPRLKSLLQKRQDGVTRKLAVFLGNPWPWPEDGHRCVGFGRQSGAAGDSSSVSGHFACCCCNCSSASQRFCRSECFADARSYGTLRKSWRVCIQRANHTSPSAFASEGEGFEAERGNKKLPPISFSIEGYPFVMDVAHSL